MATTKEAAELSRWLSRLASSQSAKQLFDMIDLRMVASDPRVRLAAEEIYLNGR